MINKDILSIEEKYRLIKTREHLIREGRNNVEIEQILLEAGFNLDSIKQGLTNLAGNAAQGIKNAWNKPATQQQQPAAQQQQPAAQQQQPAQGQKSGVCPCCNQPIGQQGQKRIIKPAQPGQIPQNPNRKYDNITAALQKIGLGEYAQNFINAGADDGVVGDLNLQTLKNTMGIESLGKRKQILQALQGQQQPAQGQQQPAAQQPAQQQQQPAATAPKKKAAPRKAATKKAAK